VKFQDVTIGRDNGNFVEIASGLAEGDRVALNISNQIADGDRVKVREEAKTLARAGSP
jgi:multidrug efflux pump subunit AcrA (membrane-fusion protein)